MDSVSVNKLIIVCIFAFAVAPSIATVVELNDDELMISAVKVENITLDDELFLYYQTDYTMVPLQSLCDILSIAITVDADRLTASGWFISEKQTFNLDLQNLTLYIQGEPVKIDENLLYANDGFDLYFDVSALELWFGIKLEMVPSQLLLKVKSTNPLPIVAQLQRQKGRDAEKVTATSGSIAVADIKNHYQFATLPVADIQTSYIHDKVEGNRSTYSIEASADLLWHQMNVAMNGDSGEENQSTRITWSRRSADRGETMVSGLTEYRFGDIFSRGDSLINKGSDGLGVILERQRGSNTQTNFSHKIIEGDAPPGWEVELYRNGSLLEFQKSGDDGRYLFVDVPLQFGENVFDIKMYGPQGQQRELQERITIGSGMVEPGTWNLYASAMRENDNLINDSNGVNNEKVSDNADINIEYGLTSSHSLGLGWTRSAFSTTEPEHDYSHITLNSAWSVASTRWQWVQDRQGGSAQHVGISTRLWDQEINLEHTAFSDFYSQHNPGGNIAAQSKLLWSGQYHTNNDNTIPILINYEKTKMTDSSSRDLLKGVVTYSWDAFRINSENSFNRSSTGLKTASGTINFNYHNKQWRVRSNLAYDLEPEVAAKKIANTMDWSWRDWNYQLKIDKGLNDTTPDTYGVNVSRRFRFGKLSLAATQSSNDDYSINASYEYSFGVNKTRPWVQGSNYRLADKGRVRMRLFLDHDLDGKYDQDVDEPLSGVKFSGRNEWNEIETNAEGFAEIPRLNATSPTRLAIDETSLNDPYLKTQQNSLLIAQHAGGYYDVEIAVSRLTELEGHVYLVRDGAKQVASGVALLLVDDRGQIVDKVRSEFDGYYYFTDVVPGNYRLQLEDKIQQNPDYQSNTPFEVFADSSLGVVEVAPVIITATGL